MALTLMALLFTVLAVAAVGLRFTSKRITSAAFGVDDWLLLASLLIYITAEILVIRCECSKGADISPAGTSTNDVFVADFVGREAVSPDDNRYKIYLQVRKHLFHMSQRRTS